MRNSLNQQKQITNIVDELEKVNYGKKYAESQIDELEKTIRKHREHFELCEKEKLDLGLKI